MFKNNIVNIIFSGLDEITISSFQINVIKRMLIGMKIILIYHLGSKTFKQLI